MRCFIYDVVFLSFLLPPSPILAWSFSSATEEVDNFDNFDNLPVDRIESAVDSRLPTWLPR